MDLTFFYAPGTISLASIIALEETGLPYTLKRVDFGAAQQKSPEFLKINPKGRVPALVTDQGILTETPAILTYIADLAPTSGLMPTDPWAAAQVQSIMSYLASTVHIAHAHRMRGHRWADGQVAQDAMKARVAGNMTECFELIEAEMLKAPWIMGADYSLADPYMFTIARWLKADGVDPAGLSKITDHMARMAARPAVQRALALAV